VGEPATLESATDTFSVVGHIIEIESIREGPLDGDT
jgi:hypothetical protein